MVLLYVNEEQAAMRTAATTGSTGAGRIFL
jgi:hypothetical protein